MSENEAAQPLIAQVCVRRDHFQVGRERPDGTGHLTLVGREWAYCAAALPQEVHVWQRTGGMPLTALSHDIDWLAPSAQPRPPEREDR